MPRGFILWVVVAWLTVATLGYSLALRKYGAERYRSRGTTRSSAGATVTSARAPLVGLLTPQLRMRVDGDSEPFVIFRDAVPDQAAWNTLKASLREGTRINFTYAAENREVILLDSLSPQARLVDTRVQDVARDRRALWATANWSTYFWIGVLLPIFAFAGRRLMARRRA